MLSAHALWINPSSLLYCTFKNFLCYFKEMYTVGIRVSFLKKVICVWKVDYSPVVYIVCTWIKLLTAWNVVRKQWIWIRFCMYSGNGGGYVQMLLDFLSTLIIRVCRLLAENRPCWHLPKHFSGKQVSFEM